ncbi:MAG TPA: xanthine dehydrogenase family protein molybdopterin-binding subunit [Micropepsaceae bacterium]|nr:xanthine dehydrogenase family protein molybdopterin-binding subunit [Micropepsaceae bacterium]
MTDAIAAIGKPRPRVDGPAKVMGHALYPSDVSLANVAHAWLVVSAIAKGHVTGFQLDEVWAVPGVLDILTHENMKGTFRTQPNPGGASGSPTTTLESDRIWHDGQIIAVVVAETAEAAREAAAKVQVEYQAESPAASFDSAGTHEHALAAVEEHHSDPHSGNAEAAYATAAVKIDGHYATPAQHHNPIELFDTTCAWDGPKLTIHEASQFVHGLRGTVARQLGMDAEDVVVESRYVGGAFGSRGGATSRTALIALAAKRLNRPVRLVPSRSQGFTIATYRAETRHRVKLGAARDGKLQALVHEGWEITSRPANYNVSGTDATSRVYGCPNIATHVSIVHADRNTPGFMRAPPETPYMFALESAMDELAAALNLDPVELRRINDTLTDPIDHVPFSSRSLMECFDRAGEAFDWRSRDPRPASMRDGDWLIGWGCASAIYSANIGAANVRLSYDPAGSAKVAIAAHEIGTGTETIIAGIVADRLNIDIARISVELGSSDLPAAGLSAGSSHAASVCNAVAKACDEIQRRIAGSNRDPGTSGLIEVYVENIPEGCGPDDAKKLYRGQPSFVEDEKHARYAFGAQFAEVRIHELTREIRVPRMTGAFAAGTIINPVTTRSQLMGGMIWGMSAALLEDTEIDRRTARYVNTNLADYLMPVNADVPSVEVILVPERDDVVNPLGMKGVGELGIVGMNAAIANAVYHATGRRIRELPIRIECLI